MIEWRRTARAVSQARWERFLTPASRHWAQIELDTVERSNTTWPILILSVAGSSLLAIFLGQDTSFDVRNYHYYSGFAFLHKPLNFDFAPAQVQSFFNPYMQVITYVLLAHLSSRTAAAILGAVQGLNLYLVYQISLSLFQRWRNPYRCLLSLGSAVAGFLGAANLGELGTSFGDNLASLLILTGILLLLRQPLSENAGAGSFLRSSCISGVIIGAASGLKLTVLIYCFAVAVAFAAASFAGRLRLRPLAAFCGCAAAGFIAAYGFWGTRLYLEYRNPVFPYLNGFFRSPYYDAHNSMDVRFLPRDLRQEFLYPFYFLRKNQWASEVTFRDARLALCYVAVVLLLGSALFLRRKGKPRLLKNRDPGALHVVFWTVFYIVAYLGWQHLFSIYRYAVVLEMLAPTFLTVVLAFLAVRRSHVFLGSLALNVFIVASVVPLNFGRQEFDDGYLRVRIPPIPELHKCVVLMAGGEPTSFVIPGFPAGTRFVRISGNFTHPGRNAELDQKIRRMLAPYDRAHTFVYVTDAREMNDTLRDTSYYNVTFECGGCREVTGHDGNRGFLCREAPEAKPVQVNAATSVHSSPAPGPVWLEVTPGEVQAGRDTVEYRVFGMKAGAIDLLYSVDGETMPPVRNWRLNRRQSVRVLVGAHTRKGLYHISGIRISGAGDSGSWIKVDASVRIR